MQSKYQVQTNALLQTAKNPAGSVSCRMFCAAVPCALHARSYALVAVSKTANARARVAFSAASGDFFRERATLFCSPGPGVGVLGP